MRIEVQLDPSRTEVTVLVQAAAMTEEVQALLERLSRESQPILAGIREGRVEVLEPEALYRVYASSGRVLAVTGKGEYVLHTRLYEVEARLQAPPFVRISGGELINLKKVDHFDLSLTGTIRVKLQNGDVTYVSRRYMAKIKKILGV